MLNGAFIWQASDSSLSKVLHVQNILPHAVQFFANVLTRALIKICQSDEMRGREKNQKTNFELKNQQEDGKS